jgi:DNA-binding transcriptional LysR family regulator
MVKAGVGISVVPEMAIGADCGCIFVPIRGDRPLRVIALAQSKQRVPTRAQQLFVNFVRQAHRIAGTKPEKASRTKSKAASSA